MFGGPCAPVLAQGGQVEVLLSFAGFERRDLGCVVTVLTAAGEFLDDLPAAGRELADDRARDVSQLRHALAWLLPFDAERTGQLGAELSLVEVAGGEPVALEDRLAVERAPVAVARASSPCWRRSRECEGAGSWARLVRC